MSLVHEKQQALYLLSAIENGTLSTSQVGGLIDDADPALVYLIVTWLRNRYGGDHPAAEGVVGRLVELSSQSSVAKKIREGKSDPISKWFEDEHSYRDFAAADFIDLVVEKLEG